MAPWKRLQSHEEIRASTDVGAPFGVLRASFRWGNGFIRREEFGREPCVAHRCQLERGGDPKSHGHWNLDWVVYPRAQASQSDPGTTDRKNHKVGAEGRPQADFE